MIYEYEKQGTGYDSGARGYELQGRKTKQEELKMSNTDISIDLETLGTDPGSVSSRVAALRGGWSRSACISGNSCLRRISKQG